MNSVRGVIPPFVDAAWLGEHRREVVLADVRWYLDGRSGAAEFEAGHLPGAVFVDLDLWLAAPADPRHGRHPLPEPEVFARGMSAAGIGDETRGRVRRRGWRDGGAARVDAAGDGHEAALLDGGIAASTARESGPVTPAPAVFTARPWPADRLAGIDDLDAGVLVDARDRNRYVGEIDRSTRARATSPAPATCRRVDRRAATGGCCRSPSCARRSPPRASPTATT